jgi:imidazole glycerol-phosphate synthase subunit HisF
MKTTRVMARLDIKGPNLLKSIQFDGHRVLGKAEYFSDIYYREGIDEIIFQDTVASLYQRNTLVDIVSKTSEKIFIPLTVAGGIRSNKDIEALLNAGADKIAINTAAVANPILLKEASKTFGSQCIVSSIEYFCQDNGDVEVWVDFGRERTRINIYDWTKQVLDFGVGEILLTSINNEGTGRGYDLEVIQKISEMSTVPVIACGGAGKAEDFVSVVKKGKADAVAAASVFHYHYLPKVDTQTMSGAGNELRMGEQIDSGNIDFLKNGYGGCSNIMVEPASISAVKKIMNQNNINTRAKK